MVRFTTEITIRRPVDIVFEHWADGRLANEWNVNVVGKDVQLLTPEPVGLGSRFRGTLKGPGTVEFEIVEYERPRKVATLAHTKIGALRHTITFEPTDEGTRLTQLGEADLKGVFRLLGPLMRIGFTKSFRENDQALKRYLEATPPA